VPEAPHAVHANPPLQVSVLQLPFEHVWFVQMLVSVVHT
jgi:hypothetical protein